MDRSVNKRRAIKYIIIIAAVLLGLAVWPLNLISRPHTTKSEEMLTDRTCHVDTDNQVMQLFGSEGDRIRRLDVRITEAQPGSQLQLNLFDADRNKLLHREVTVSDEDIEKGWVSFKLGYDLEKGGSYFLELRVPEVTGWMPDEDLQRLNSSLIILGLEDHGTTTATANSYVTTVQEELQDYNLILRYHYLIDFNVIMTVVAYLLLTLVAFLLIRFVIPRFVSADSEVSLGKVFATVLDPIIIVSALILLIQIFPICTFGRKWYDIVFNYIGVCMLAGLLLYLIHRKDAFKALCDLKIREIVTNGKFIPEVIRVISIAYILWYGYTYINGLYDIHHTYAYRRMLIAFLVMIISTFTKKEILNIINGIWLVAGSVGAYCYAHSFDEEVKDAITCNLEGAIIVLGGFVIINLISSLIRAIMKKAPIYAVPRLPVMIPTALFVIGMMVWSNTRVWPFYLAFIVAVLFWRLIFTDAVRSFNRNLCDGIILNYVMMTVFSLLHRPYYAYRMHRYSMGFHTVTVTAVYMTLILSAVGVKLFIASRKADGNARAVFDKLLPYLILMGSAMNYMLFTLSRTGYLSAIIMTFVSFVVLSLIYDQKGSRLNGSFKRFLVVLGAMAIMFPITFTATRLIPAIADDPVVFDYEVNDITIYRGNAKDSDNYMNIYRFCQVFASKVLGVGDTITDSGIEDPLKYRERPAGTRLVPGEGIMATAQVGMTDLMSVLDHRSERNAESDDSRIPVNGIGIAVTSAQGVAEQLLSERFIMLTATTDPDGEDYMNQISNGRMDIFKCYLEQSNLWGHDTMGALLNDGSIATHAHNTYLQAIYDHGWIFGLYFTLFLVYIFLYSVITIKKRGDKDPYCLLFPVLLCGLMSAGLVEWVFHPCYPICTALLLSMTSLSLKPVKKKTDR